MFKINNSEIGYIFSSMIWGIGSFFISGLLGCKVLLHFDNYILVSIIVGGIGGFLLGLFNWKHKMIGRMTIAGSVAALFGIIGAFILVESIGGGLGLLFPSVVDYFESNGIADIIAIILMGILFGVIFSAIVYGRKSIGLFSIVCGTVSIPFGLLVRAMNSGYWIKVWLENLFKIFGEIDLNFLAIIMEFGIGISIGIYIMSKQRSNESEV